MIGIDLYAEPADYIQGLDCREKHILLSFFSLLKSRNQPKFLRSFSQGGHNYDPSYDIKSVLQPEDFFPPSVAVTKHQAQDVNVHKTSIIDEVKLGNTQILRFRLS